jgi:hypothetical protein
MFMEVVMNVDTMRERSSEYLEAFRPTAIPVESWRHVASGSWEESPYRSGYSSYHIANNHFLNTWVVISTDEPDEEDKEEKHKAARKSREGDHRDQILFDLGEVVPEATKTYPSCSNVIAICRDAPKVVATEEMAEIMYDALWASGYGLSD